MGLQSDGTAIIGDRLALSYGVTFGTPSAITWYKDGSVLKTWSSGNSGQEGLNQDGGLWKDVDAGDGAGTYSATVVAEGVTYTTNEIVVTTAEEAAEIIDFYIEDDYTDGTDIDYDTKDTKAIATVVLKKNYDGKILIYKENDNKFKGAIDKIATSTDVAEQATKYYVDEDENGGNHAITAGGSVLTTDQATNFQVSNLATAGAGVGHINADGSVTYKFVVDNGIFTRGQEYVAVFDQASVVTDTPGTGIANVYDEPATVPYVEEPAAIAVTKVSAGNYPEVSFLDEDGDVLAWFGETDNQLSTSGIDKGEIYYATYKTNDPDKGTAQKVAIARPGNVEKGVWKSNVKAAPIIDAYWFASVTTKKGIFGKDAVTLVSEAVPVAQKSADTINLVESSSDAETATVKFTNLRADGTVYIVRGLKERTNAVNPQAAHEGDLYNSWNGADYYTSVANIFKAYEAGIAQAIVGRTTVEAGAASVDISQAISKFETNAGAGVMPNTALGTNVAGYFPTNNYIAVFVPDDEDNYGMIYTADGWANVATKEDSAKGDDSQGLSLEQVATSVKYEKTSAGTAETAKDSNIDAGATDNHTITISGSELVAYDQFGDKMTATVASTAATVTVTDKAIDATERASATYEVDGNGLVTVVITAAGCTDKGDGYTVSLLGSDLSVIAAINTKEATEADGTELENGTASAYTVKLGSTTVVNPYTQTLEKMAATTATAVTAGDYTTLATSILKDKYGAILRNLTLSPSVKTKGQAGANVTKVEAKTDNDGKLQVKFTGTLANGADLVVTIMDRDLTFTVSDAGAKIAVAQYPAP